MRIDPQSLRTCLDTRTIKDLRAEIERIYYLPDRWLAEELLRLVRQVRAELPDQLSFADRATSHACSLVWDVVPEIARRLGSRSLSPDESRDPKVTDCEHDILRQYAGICLKFSALSALVEQRCPDSVTRLLVREISEGNPIAIGLDRLSLASGTTPPQDLIARHMSEWSRANGLDEVAAWQPNLLPKPQ